MTVFAIGIAWARLEYKGDQQNAELKAMIREYVIENNKDKDMLVYQMGELRSQVDVNTTVINAITDFIKPDAPEVKRNKKAPR